MNLTDANQTYTMQRKKIIIALLLLFLITLFYTFGQVVYIMLYNQLSINQPCVPLDEKEHSQSSPTIPLTIHQTWKDDNLSGFTNSQSSWKNFKDLKYKFWTDGDIENLIDEYYPYYRNTFDSFPMKIQKVDFARYLILYHEGGVYADLDCYPKVRYKKTLLSFLKSYGLVLVDSSLGSLSNEFLAGEKGHDFLAYVMNNTAQLSFRSVIPFIGVMFSTGPEAWTKMYIDWQDDNEEREVMILRHNAGQCRNNYELMLHHGTLRSWHTWDSAIFSALGDYDEELIFMLEVLIVLLILWLIRHRISGCIYKFKK